MIIKTDGTVEQIAQTSTELSAGSFDMSGDETEFSDGNMDGCRIVYVPADDYYVVVYH